MDNGLASAAARQQFLLWCLVVVALLIAGRWPAISRAQEIYPDETQLLSGAITLRHDPVFWRAVDGHTAGPLDFYALLPATCLQGTAAYGGARFIAALVLAFTLIAAGEAIGLIAGTPLARLAVLPAVAFEALTTSPELVHYSTELVPGALLAGAVWAIVRQTIMPRTGNLVIAAVLLGFVPYAKLQAAPIAAFVGLLLVGFEIRAQRWQSVTLLVCLALAPTLLIAMVLTIVGEMKNFVIPYLMQNSLYASTGRLPVASVFAQQLEQSQTNGYHALWLGGTLAFTAGAIAFARKFPPALTGYLAATTLTAVVALACILATGRPYHHYLNLLTLPVTILGGVALAMIIRRETTRRATAVRAICGLLACALLPQLALWLSPRGDPYEYYNTSVTARSPGQIKLVALIQQYAKSGEALGVWGWRSSLYVEAARRQATREAHTAGQFVAGPWQGYFLQRYFEDLAANSPSVFADAAGPGNFWFNARRMGHELFPRLRDWIAANYTLLDDVEGVRLYVRNDRLAGAAPARSNR